MENMRSFLELRDFHENHRSKVEARRLIEAHKETQGWERMDDLELKKYCQSSSFRRPSDIMKLMYSGPQWITRAGLLYVEAIWNQKFPAVHAAVAKYGFAPALVYERCSPRLKQIMPTDYEKYSSESRHPPQDWKKGDSVAFVFAPGAEEDDASARQSAPSTDPTAMANSLKRPLSAVSSSFQSGGLSTDEDQPDLSSYQVPLSRPSKRPRPGTPPNSAATATKSSFLSPSFSGRSNVELVWLEPNGLHQPPQDRDDPSVNGMTERIEQLESKVDHFTKVIGSLNVIMELDEVWNSIEVMHKAHKCTVNDLNVTRQFIVNLARELRMCRTAGQSMQAQQSYE